MPSNSCFWQRIPSKGMAPNPFNVTCQPAQRQNNAIPTESKAEDGASKAEVGGKVCTEVACG
jgi:hypothetical protein